MPITLKDLIEELKKLPQDGVVPYGFGEPYSYRGYYEDVAFEPVENAKVSDMLDYAARSALGATFEGYKGGEYTMYEYTDCYIAKYGHSDGDGIGKTLINMWKHSLGVD